MMILSIFNLIAISDTRQIVYAEIDVDEQTQQEDAFCDDAEDESKQEYCDAVSKGNVQNWHDDEKHDGAKILNLDDEELKELIEKETSDMEEAEEIEDEIGLDTIGEIDIDREIEEMEEENKELDKGVEVSEEPEQEEEFETNNEEVEEVEEESEPEDEEGEE
jgi:hypothetical protein